MLETSYLLTEEHIQFYQKHHYIKLKHVLDEVTLAYFNERITHYVEAKSVQQLPLEQRDTYGKAFIQLTNLWTEDQEVKKLVFSKRLASIATQLMQVEGVRLYHDQALFKEAGGGITPWHADQYYWPLASDKCITAWIPLQKTPLEMGPLEFSSGSHHIKEGRDLQIGDASEQFLSKKLRVKDFPHIIEPFDAGEISFHSGWIFHRAGANTSTQTRKVMTVIYMDKQMRLKEPENAHQIEDWKVWCPGAKVGEIIDTELNPVLFG